MWVLSAKAALEKENSDDTFYQSKLVTARYFFERVLPEADSHFAKLLTGADTLMALHEEQF